MVSGTYFSESNSARTELNFMFLCSIIVVDWGDWGGISPWRSSFRNEMGCQRWECNTLSIAASLKALFAEVPEKYIILCVAMSISLCLCGFLFLLGRYCEILRASVGITVGLVRGILICCSLIRRLNVNNYRLSSRHWKETSVEGYIIVFPFFFLLPNIQCKWQMAF